MNKKIYLLLTVLLAWSFNLKAQTAQIESLTANPGSTVSFDITVGDLPTDVGAVSLFIGYDPNVLTFVGSTLVDAEFAGYVINNMSATNQVGIQWSDPFGADINGVLLSLEFQYSSLGGSCDLVFGPGCEFADINLNSIPVSYTNGSIGPNAGIATITIDELLATAGPVSVGVTGAGFDEDAGALTLFIDFDEDVLQFSGYTTSLTGLSLGVNNTTGVISVAYSNYLGQSINTTFLTLNFVYDGTGESELIFFGDCEVAYTDLSEPVVSYDNGMIEPMATAYSLTLDNVVAIPGNVIGIPITAAGYDPAPMGAITLYIGYNPAHLEFVNITDGTITGASANVVSPGLVGITWSDAGGALIDGTLLTLNFDYNFGASAITFEGGCELTDVNLTLFPSTYFDGSIAPVLGGPEISMPTLTGTIGQTLDVPITAKNFIADPGAISLFIGYDDAVLTYTGSIDGTLSGYYINAMPNSQIGIQWSDLSGIDIDPNNDDVILTLQFTYNGGTCPLSFEAGCEFAETDLTFIPVAYYDGALVLGSLFDLTILLEGPTDTLTGTMFTTLNEYGLLPLTQPYSGEPWFYTGTESVATIPNVNVVDWVLLEVRESTGDASTATADSVVLRQAGFLLADGSIVDLDGESNILVPTAFEDNVYVVIYHRNHIRVMSADALTMVDGALTYDFTDDATKTYDSQIKYIGGGYYGLYTGDLDNDGLVFVSDLDMILPLYPQFFVYSVGDLDLDGLIFVSDLDLILPNYPTFTFIP
jgi:hypothetical protein